MRQVHLSAQSIAWGIIVFVILIVASVPLYAQQDGEQAVSALVDTAQAYRDQQKYDSSLLAILRADSILMTLENPADSLYLRVKHAVGVGGYSTGRMDICSTYWHEAYDYYDRTGLKYDSLYGIILTRLGTLYFTTGQYDKAVRYFGSARDIRSQVLGKNHYQTGRSTSNLATAYNIQGKFKEAEPLYFEALEILKKTAGEISDDVANTLRNIAIVYNGLENAPKAEEYFRKALAVKEKLVGPDHPAIGSLLDNIAVQCIRQGRYAEAEPLDLRALEIRRKALGPEHPEVALTLNNLAGLYWLMGRYSKANPLFEEALEIRRKILPPDDPDLATSMTNMAIAYMESGRYEDALAMHDEALAIKKKNFGDNSREVATSLQNMGLVYEQLKRYKEALPYYEKSLHIREKALGPEHTEVARSLHNLSAVYQKLDRTAEADSLERRSLHIFVKEYGPDHPDVALGLFSLGMIVADRGDYVQAESLMTRAESIWKNALSAIHPYLAMCDNMLARLYAARGDQKAALGRFRRFLSRREDFIRYAFSFSSTDQKMRWIDRFTIIDNALLTLAIERPRSEYVPLAFEMVLNGKSTVIDAMMAERRVMYCAGDSSIAALRQEHRRHATLIANLVMTDFGGGAQQFKDSLQTLFHVQDSLETILSRLCAEARPLTGPKQVTARDIESNLQPDEAVLEYVMYTPVDYTRFGRSQGDSLPSCYLCFVATPTGNITVTDLGPATAIDSLVQEVRDELEESPAKLYTENAAEKEADFQKLLGTLYARVWKPIAEQIEAASTVYICPDGLLHLLPFEILYTDRNHYLIEEYATSYLSSSRELTQFTYDTTHVRSAVFFSNPDFDFPGVPDSLVADRLLAEQVGFVAPLENIPARSVTSCLQSKFTPLRFAGKELRGVTGVLQRSDATDVTVFQGQEAREETIKKLSTPPGILHIITHGFFCEKQKDSLGQGQANPLLTSGLALAGANGAFDSSAAGTLNGEDGLFTAYEASELNLIGTELVTLSACETGVGHAVRGEGVFGLRRAFRHAGANSILMSLWKIPDKETAELMFAFYDRWLSGDSKRQALREAELSALRRERAERGHGHPFFWGGFVLAGKPD